MQPSAVVNVVKFCLSKEADVLEGQPILVRDRRWFIVKEGTSTLIKNANDKKNIIINSIGYWSFKAKCYDKTNWVRDHNLLKVLFSLLPYNDYKPVFDMETDSGAVAEALIEQVGLGTLI